MGLLDRQCDGTCVTAQAQAKIIEDLRAQLMGSTRTMLALVDAKAYKQRYPTEKAQPIVEAEKESDVYSPPMSMAEIQRAAEQADDLDRMLKVKR